AVEPTVSQYSAYRYCQHRQRDRLARNDCRAAARRRADACQCAAADRLAGCRARKTDAAEKIMSTARRALDAQRQHAGIELSGVLSARWRKPEKSRAF